jgi:hypothetical protein
MPQIYRIRVSDGSDRRCAGLSTVCEPSWSPGKPVIEGLLILLQDVDQVGVEVLHVECAAGGSLRPGTVPVHGRLIPPG